MSIKIDLRIFFFGILFFLTKQIELYATLMIFAFLHELGHLSTGMILGFKPQYIEINPLGFKISFKINVEDFNKKIRYGNEICMKKIVIALAGPIVNLFIILICKIFDMDLIISKETIIYSNILLAIYNLLPIYPLDGGRVLKEILHIFKGKKKSYIGINIVSKITVSIMTIVFAILIIYTKNIAFLLVIIYLWYLTLKNKKESSIYMRTLNLIENTAN